MSRRNKLLRAFVLLLTAVMLLTACSANALETARSKKKKSTPTPVITLAPTAEPAQVDETEAPAEPTAEPGPMEAAQELADYLFEHGELPENFITKKEAERMGWKTTYRYVSDLGPGITIGGDYFGNYEQKLPAVKGRKYAEADCYYQGGPRNEYRIIYSNDGHVWYTGDHYNTFIELYPTDQ